MDNTNNLKVKFETECPANLRCVSCKDVLNKESKITECFHQFCEPCIANHKACSVCEKVWTAKPQKVDPQIEDMVDFLWQKMVNKSECKGAENPYRHVEVPNTNKEKQTFQPGAKGPSDCSKLEAIKKKGHEDFTARDKHFLSVEANGSVILTNCFVLKNVRSYKESVYLNNCTADSAVSYHSAKLINCTIHTLVDNEKEEVNAKGCSLAEVQVNGYLKIEDCEVNGKVYSGEDDISAKNSRLQDVQAIGNINLINCSANDLISRDGKIKAKSKRGTRHEINSINAKKSVKIKRISADKIESQGGLSAKYSTLGTVTVHGKVNLENCSGAIITPSTPAIITPSTPQKTAPKIYASYASPRIPELSTKIYAKASSSITFKKSPEVHAVHAVHAKTSPLDSPERSPNIDNSIIPINPNKYSFVAENQTFDELVCEQDIALTNCTILGTVQSLNGKVALTGCRTKNAIAKGNLYLKNSEVETQASSKTLVAIECKSLGEVEARTNVTLTKSNVTGTVKCTEGHINAEGCSLQNVDGHGNITLKDSDAGNVTSFTGKIEIDSKKKTVNVKDITTKIDLELINVSAENIYVRDGALTAKECTLGNVTARNKIYLVSSSGNEIESKTSFIHSRGTESRPNRFNKMTAYADIDLVSTQIDTSSLKSMTGKIFI